MLTNTKISLQVPGSNKLGQFFSFRLQDKLRNEPSRYKPAKSVFVVSDIEGNFKAFTKLLFKNNVVNKYLQWNFKDGHLVILGDCFDRGEYVLECLWLIYSLEDAARREGGYVHFILGNHEIMNLNGDWRYRHPKYAEKPSASRFPTTAMYDGSNEIWRWLLTKNIIEKIGDVLFVHGGIAHELIQSRLSIEEINETARPYYARANQLFSDPVLHNIFNSDRSPFWYRGYYQQAPDDSFIEDTLNYFNVKAIVTGHTVVETITTYFNGRLINVDTDHAGGRSEGLLIKGRKFYRADSIGKKYRLNDINTIV